MSCGVAMAMAVAIAMVAMAVAMAIAKLAELPGHARPWKACEAG